MIIAQILAAAFGIGCVAAVGYFARVMFSEGDSIPAILTLAVGLPVAAFIGIAPTMLLQESESPILATLHKGEWACTSAHSESVTTFVMSGKVMVPITTTHKVCDEYGRAS